MSVTLSEVKRAARAHRAPLAGESAGYLVLALADQVLSAPRLIEAADCQLTDEGGLRVLRGQASTEADAELSLRRALDSLLLVASSGSAALTRASRRVASVGLPGLVRELEAALIPVNRSAARRALARLQRETARAVASGALAPEELEAPLPASSLPEVSLLAASAFAASAAKPSVPAVSATAIDEPPEQSLEPGQLSEALTIALDVRPVVVAPAEMLQSDEDVEFIDEDVEFIDDEPSDALTVARQIEVRPTPAAAEPAFVELREEACTRPEPVIVRQSMRPSARAPVPLAAVEGLPQTPTLGSLAAELPVLAPEQIAEMTRREVAEAKAGQVELEDAVRVALEQADPVVIEQLVEASAPAAEVPPLIVCSAPSNEHTEPMPEVLPLSPGVALVASRKSELSELLANFQVGPEHTQQGLARAIKEMADLDLTPAPFAALIR